MALYMISYDIAEQDADEYEPLWTKLRSWGSTKILYSQWVVDGSVGNTGSIYNDLTRIIHELSH